MRDDDDDAALYAEFLERSAKTNFDGARATLLLHEIHIPTMYPFD